MSTNAAVQSTVNLQITDLITQGSPIVYNRNTGPLIFNSKTNSIFDYFIAPGISGGASLPFSPGTNPSFFGTIYVRNVSPPTVTPPILRIVFIAVSGNVDFPLSSGAVFLYTTPGNSGQVGLPNDAIGSINIITNIDVTIEYCFSI
jgi:hypothetical protein